MVRVQRGVLGLIALALAGSGCEAADSAADASPADSSAGDTATAADTADTTATDDTALQDAAGQDSAADAAAESDAKTVEPDAASTDAIEPDTSLPPTGEAQLGPMGGQLVSADGKASVSVPPGALSLPADFAITPVAEPPGTATLVSGVYDFAPDGASFAVPLTLCLAVDETKIAGMDACLLYYSSEAASWACVEGPLYTAGPGLRCGLTTHFTPFAVGKRVVKGGGQTKLNLGKDKQSFPLPGGGVLGVAEGTVSEPLAAWAEELPPPADSGALGSPVVALGPTDAPLAKPLTLCLPVDPAVYAAKSGCLAALDSSVTPPKWVCEDPCLTKLADNLVCGETKHLRTFAVLLGAGGDAATCAPKTPIGPEGGVVVSADGAGLMHVPAGAVEKTLPFVAVASSSPVEAKLGSAVVQITPSGTKFAKDATVCLRALPGVDAKGGCLAYLDETANPPVWKCEDECLQPGGGDYLCGKTDHLTNFAILLSGKGGSGSSSCGADDEYILGKEGGIVVAQGGATVVQFPPGAVESPVVPLVNMVTPTDSSAPLGSGVVEVSLPGGKQPLQPVTICLATPPTLQDKGACLAYWDSAAAKPEWKCQDQCLTSVGDNLLCGQTDHFTNFAILLGGGGDASVCAAKTPIGPEGGVVFSPDGAGWLHVPAKALEKPIPFVAVTSASPVDAKLGSAVVEITPSGTKFATPATVCLRQLPGVDTKGACLAYLDVSAKTAVWKCEDPCLEPGGGDYLCGTTGHLTSFAILLGAGSSPDTCKLAGSPGFIAAGKGGVLTAGDGAVWLEIPAGALAKDTAFSISKSAVKTEAALSPAWDIGPEGQTLAQPATLCLKPSQPLQVGDGLCLASADALGKWQCEDPCLTQNNDGLLCGKTNHFSTWAIAKVAGAVCK